MKADIFFSTALMMPTLTYHSSSTYVEAGARGHYDALCCAGPCTTTGWVPCAITGVPVISTRLPWMLTPSDSRHGVIWLHATITGMVYLVTLTQPRVFGVVAAP